MRVPAGNLGFERILGFLGLDIGDAEIIRSGGGGATLDVLQ